MDQPVATIIAAVIGALATFAGQRIDRVFPLFHRAGRSISGVWEGESWVLRDPIPNERTDMKNRKPDATYVADIKQAGRRVRGTIDLLQELPDGARLKHKVKGHVEGEFYIYEMATREPKHFRVSTAVLHINDIGSLMEDYFVANAGEREEGRTIVGLTTMKRRT